MSTARKEDHIDQLFYALSDRTRRKMLKQLTNGTQNVSDLGQSHGISKQAISKHLQVLESAKLITKERDGRVQHCSINPEILQLVENVIADYLEY